jgi:hypothetical protein
MRAGRANRTDPLALIEDPAGVPGADRVRRGPSVVRCRRHSYPERRYAGLRVRCPGARPAARGGAVRPRRVDRRRTGDLVQDDPARAEFSCSCRPPWRQELKPFDTCRWAVEGYGHARWTSRAGRRTAVFPFVQGRAADDDDWQVTARALRRVHELGGIDLPRGSMDEPAIWWLRDHLGHPWIEDRGSEVAENIRRLERAIARATAKAVPHVVCHRDFLGQNMLIHASSERSRTPQRGRWLIRYVSQRSG